MAAARQNWVIWAVNLLLAATAFAQEAPTFRTGARLVEVQVVATVKGGQPARGLTEADFEVLENGKPQKIAFFAQPPERLVERPQPLPAGLFTNRPEYSAGSPRGVTAIVLGRWTPSPVERQKIASALGVAPEEISWGHATPFQHLYGHGPG